MADVAVICYADLCRAAAYTKPNTTDPSALRLLVADLDSELKVIYSTPHLLLHNLVLIDL